MNARANASRAIAARRILEVAITPGLYLALVIGLLLGYYLVSGFVEAVDSSGFNAQLHPVYDLIARSLTGAFGATFVAKLFAEGPFLLALYAAFAPVFLYLAVSSVFRFGLEKNVGAVELLTYGPADGTAYFTAFFIKDVLVTLAAALVLLVFFGAAAALNNLVLGPAFFHALVAIFFASMAVYAYGILASVLTDNAASSIALFIGFVALFLFIQMGTLTIVSGYVRSLSTVLAWIINWLSPLFYWNLGLEAVEVGQAGRFLLSLLALLALSGVVLYASHHILKARGVRP